MPIFDITDDSTGQVLSLEGDNAPEAGDIPALFQQFRKGASDTLSEGKFKFDENFTKRDKSGQNKEIRSLVAQAIGVGDGAVDVEQGMGFIGRSKLSALSTEGDKIKHLEDTYGAENVKHLNIDGKDSLFYRDENETSGMFRIVDERGTSISDFTADLLGFVPEVAGAVAGAAKGAALGTAIAPGVGTLVGGVLGAAAGGFTAGAAQDVAVRAASGEDIQLGEIAGRRGKEAAIGVVADVALLGTGRIASKFLRRAGLRETAGDAFADSVQAIKEAGGEVGETTGLKAGGKALEREAEVAAARPSSKVAKIRESNRQSLINLADEMSGKSTPVEAAGRIADNARQSKLDIESFIRESDSRAGKII